MHSKRRGVRGAKASGSNEILPGMCRVLRELDQICGVPVFLHTHQTSHLRNAERALSLWGLHIQNKGVLIKYSHDLVWINRVQTKPYSLLHSFYMNVNYQIMMSQYLLFLFISLTAGGSTCDTHAKLYHHKNVPLYSMHWFSIWF